MASINPFESLYLRSVGEYYDNTLGHYRRMLDLDDNMALHCGFWFKDTRDLGEALQNQNRTVAEQAALQPGDYVLDAGCGVGGTAIYLAKTIGCRVRGITLSEKQVNMARQYARRHGVSELVSFEVEDFSNTSSPDGSFDAVIGIESICHATDKTAFLREAYRLLKPGGRLVVSDGLLVRSGLTETEEKDLNHWLDNMAVNYLEHRDTFLRQMQELGFQHISNENMSPYVMRSARRLSRWATFGMAYLRFIRRLGFRPKYDTPANEGNILACIYSHKTLKEGIWEHSLVKGVKPDEDC